MAYRRGANRFKTTSKASPLCKIGEALAHRRSDVPFSFPLPYFRFMSANASPCALRRAVLAAPLADYASHHLEIDCGTAGCRARRYRIADLAGVNGRVTLFRDLIRRMRCRTCGQAPRSVVLLVTMGQRRAWVARTGLVGEN